MLSDSLATMIVAGNDFGFLEVLRYLALGI
jgi:hypothetical protein